MLRMECASSRLPCPARRRSISGKPQNVLPWRVATADRYSAEGNFAFRRNRLTAIGIVRAWTGKTKPTVLALDWMDSSSSRRIIGISREPGRLRSELPGDEE
ncbi:MAG TPA: hypothetical protein HA264_04880 [Methanolinea sp.]|nr:hypothetical protein [Methanolinea sp.]